jgi:putative intracellular protease/amidase
MNQLSSLRVAVLVTDGFEESELFTPVQALQAQGTGKIDEALSA